MSGVAAPSASRANSMPWATAFSATSEPSVGMPGVQRALDSTQATTLPVPRLHWPPTPEVQAEALLQKATPVVEPVGLDDRVRELIAATCGALPPRQADALEEAR